MYASVKEVKPFPNYILLLTFDNNEKRILDMSPYLDKGIFKELKDPALFNTVKVSFDTIEWANTADLCPEFLYAESKPYEN
jgi:hypothetical protein